ncbi:LacI family DNA-binding transcriptional regulator [Carnobacterium mobile]|uniref:LacI family DNA-binding transcriptional regulator n=1 Tax=Carnobacterium mobile TaxID=2750 RepID=UPI00186653C0|nr:LacI family DNA-binding transcriptional regulator [Carnobacterium mobile]
MNRLTIRDVAREAGVSIATVSKALNDVDVVRPETKNKVLEVAERLQYVPNLMGKQLKSGRTKMLGFYTSSVSGPYFNTLVESIAREAEKSGYGVNVFVSNDKQVVLNSIMGNVVDGIIGFEELIRDDNLQAMKRERIKAVFIDRNISAETMGSVVFDSFDKGYEATEYLVHLGHKRIAYVAGFNGVYDNDERFKGYKAALKSHDISFNEEYILEGLFEEERAYHSVYSYIKNCKGTAPTAFLAGNDLSAIGAIKALKTVGYDIPNDISVIGFDDIEVLQYFTPGLTTVHNPIAEQGALAVKQLLNLISGTQTGTSLQLQGELIIRNSATVPTQ